MFKTKLDFKTYVDLKKSLYSQDTGGKSYKCVKKLLEFGKKFLNENKLLDAMTLLKEGKIIIQRDNDNKIKPFSENFKD